MRDFSVCLKSFIFILIFTLVVNLEVNLMSPRSQQQVSQQRSHPLSLRLHQCHRTKSRGSRPARELLPLLYKPQLIWMEPLQLLLPRLCWQMWQRQVVMLHLQERNLESRMCKCIVCKSCFPHDYCGGLNHSINVISTLPLPSLSSLLNVPKVHCNTVADFSAEGLTFCVWHIFFLNMKISVQFTLKCLFWIVAKNTKFLESFLLKFDVRHLCKKKHIKAIFCWLQCCYRR